MPEGITTNSIRWALARLRDKVALTANELNELDGVLGDGDLGVTLSRAAEALGVEAAKLPDDVGLALLNCAQVFNRASAGTYGTLMATGLVAVAKATKGRTVVPWTEVSSLLAASLKSMSDRSQGQLGDKTVLDAIEAVRHATEALDEPAAMADAAKRAIAGSLDHFRNLPFRQGRARVFGSKGIGRDDPGMIAFQRIVEALA